MRAQHDASNAVPAVPLRSLRSGILVRPFDAVCDAYAIERFIRDRDFDAARDTIFVAELHGRILGVLALRLEPFVHTFELDAGPIARGVADALTQYLKGYTQASGFREVMFCVEHANTAMARFVTERGAVPEEPADVYTMQL